jgi:hypothetical protein
MNQDEYLSDALYSQVLGDAFVKDLVHSLDLEKVVSAPKTSKLAMPPALCC